MLDADGPQLNVEALALQLVTSPKTGLAADQLAVSMSVSTTNFMEKRCEHAGSRQTSLDDYGQHEASSAQHQAACKMRLRQLAFGVNRLPDPPRVSLLNFIREAVQVSPVPGDLVVQLEELTLK
jgi:hypothetical protein